MFISSVLIKGLLPRTRFFHGEGVCSGADSGWAAGPGPDGSQYSPTGRDAGSGPDGIYGLPSQSTKSGPYRPSWDPPFIAILWLFGGWIFSPLFVLGFIGDVATHSHIHWWYLAIIASWIASWVVVKRLNR